MKTLINKMSFLPFLLAGLMIFSASIEVKAAFFQEFTEYRGIVVDQDNNRPIPSAYLNVNGTNLSTVTNSEGEFSLKVPVNLKDGIVTVSSIGYISFSIPLSIFEADGTSIVLADIVEDLSEVSMFTSTDPKVLVRNMFSKSGVNYVN